MATSDEIEAGQTELIRKITGTRKRLHKAVHIYHDVHIAGDDAFELFEETSKIYSTKFHGFLFGHYFPGETESLWHYLKSCLGFADRSRKSLTFGHLVAVVEQGAWFEPIPNGASTKTLYKANRLLVAATKPESRHYEGLSVFWRSERSYHPAGMPILECCPFDKFAFSDISLATSELTYFGRTLPTNTR
jgi:hypothetical protein